MLIVYTHRCAPCKYKSELKAVNQLSRSINTRVAIKEVRSSSLLMKEAAQLTDISIPFVHNTDTKSSISLYNIREWL